MVLSKYEVSQSQYKHVMDSPATGDDDPLPASGVAHAEALSFCELTVRRTKHVIRIPREEEWEYACRAGTKAQFYSGNKTADGESAGWFGGNSQGRICVVGLKLPNAFGLYDLHGNVAEWCAEFYRGSYEWVDMELPAWELPHVIRGGSIISAAKECASRARGCLLASDQRCMPKYPVGIRAVVEVSERADPQQ